MDFACCAGPTAEPLSEDHAAELATVLKVLADPVRLRLLSLVAKAPGGDVCACDLVGVLDRSQPTISHHLKVLFEAGVLDKERRGVWIHYSLRSDAIAGVCDALGIACGPVAAAG
ncbi:MAG: metalloregulator ArsR/SmtB family transcription factor [Actinomycetota bacterium]|jgi:ArsR family transcriptional regulator, arsenate/arsenite/antimonite-responsive transcriptional repressor|nr:metalloregulator ArsR/SmtB family transcription factor [Actinomycetota bacterium]